MLFTHVFFMSVNSNFAGELLGKFQLSYSLAFSNGSASADSFPADQVALKNK